MSKSKLYSAENYYRLEKAFWDEHRDKATSIVVDNISGMPIKAEYYFEPWTVERDHKQRLRAVSEALGEEFGE